MNGVSFYNPESKLQRVFTLVGAGLLDEIRPYSSLTVSTENLRPAQYANQPRTRYVKTTLASMDTKRVGLKRISNYFVKGSNSHYRKRPTPTFLKFYGGVS
jgi:hypothetical protein